MSILPPEIPQNLQFYLSGPRPCPYLQGQIERKLFTHISPGDSRINIEINSALCRLGFRRSQTIVYRPACSDCMACVPVRIPVDNFSPSKSQRRILLRNRDLHMEQEPAAATPELFALFSAYQKERHAESDMASMTKADFAAMLKEGQADTHVHCLRDGAGVLKGCMLSDHTSDGFSAVYSFFASAEPQRSLGTALILFLVECARERGLPYVYLGYWIKEARKMLYKTRFRPLQAFGPEGWDWVEDKEKGPTA